MSTHPSWCARTFCELPLPHAPSARHVAAPIEWASPDGVQVSVAVESTEDRAFDGTLTGERLGVHLVFDDGDRTDVHLSEAEFDGLLDSGVAVRVQLAALRSRTPA